MNAAVQKQNMQDNYDDEITPAYLHQKLAQVAGDKEAGLLCQRLGIDENNKFASASAESFVDSVIALALVNSGRLVTVK